MNHPRLLLVTALAALVPAILALPTDVRATSPAATFDNPPPGVIEVLTPGSTITVQWTESADVQGRSIVVQSARPLPRSGCDTRWMPGTATPLDGHEYRATGLVSGRCYRFALALETALGPETVISAPVIVVSGGFGPSVTFTNPIKRGLTFYDTKATISWIEEDTFGAAITSRKLTEQSTASVDGACADADWSSATSASVAVTTTSTVRTVVRTRCYRYVLTLRDAKGYERSYGSSDFYVAAALPAWTGTFDLYRSNAFVTQYTMTWCVAASSQLMINIVLGGADTSRATQEMLITYGQAHDGADYEIGTDPLGWVAMLNRYGAGGYSIATYSSAAAAVKSFARRMRLTNKPVGIIVMSGGHAWVVTGFKATADPAATTSYTVTGLFVEGPLYPRTPNSRGYDLPPDTLLTLSQLGKFYTAYYDWHYRVWDGTWVAVVP